MIRKFSLSLFVLFCLAGSQIRSIAQQKLQVMTPPPPDVSALGKFGLIPVDNFTGIPGISIPIFTLTDGTLTAPISLQYHAGGIKVKEEASEVGLGWALNVGGTITTLVRGKPDFERGGFRSYWSGAPDNPDIIKLKKTPLVNMGVVYNLWQNDDHIFGNIESGLTFPHNGIDKQYYNEFIVGYEGEAPDYASDLYTIMLGDKSYNFVFDNNFNPVILGDGALKIELIDNGQYPDWKITDEKGVVYYFQQRQFNYSNNFYPANATTSPHLNTWHLSKMISPTYGEIKFKYLYSTKVFTSPLPSLSELFLVGNISPHTQQKRVTVTANYSSYEQLNIDSVITSLGFAKFLYGDQRLDLQGARRLQGIELRDNNKKLIKKVTLDNDSYFDAEYAPPVGTYLGDSEFERAISNMNGFTASHYSKRLKLNSLTEIDVNNSDNLRKHSFTYNEQRKLPHKLSLSIDHWGYYNGAANFELVPPCEVSIRMRSELQSFTGADRNANPNTTQANILTSVKYPTGGSTTYSYETNQVEGTVTEVSYTSETSGFFKTENSNAINRDGFLDINGNFTVTQESVWNGKRVQIFASAYKNSSSNVKGSLELLIKKNGNNIIKRIPMLPSGSQNTVVDTSLVLSPGNYNISYNSDSSPDIYYACQLQRNVTILKISKVEKQVKKKFYYGGLRVGEIRNVDPITLNVNVKKFTYSGLTNQATPIYESPQGFDQYHAPSTGEYPNAGQNFFRYRYGESVYPFSDASSSPYSGYANVQITEGEKDSLTGKSEYTYDTSVNYSITEMLHYGNRVDDLSIVNPVLPGIPSVATGGRGKLLEEKQFKLIDTTFIPVSSTKYRYTTKNSSYIYQMLFNQGLSWFSSPGYDNGQLFRIYAHQFQIPILRNLLNSIEHYEYDAVGKPALTTYENYFYDNVKNHFQLIRKATGNSSNDTLNTYLKYPQDYDNLLSTTSLDPVSKGIQQLQKAHVITPVEVYNGKTSSSSASTRTYLNGLINTFNSDLPTSNQILILQTAQSLPSFSPSTVSGGVFVKDGSYASRVNFTKYDPKGRLLEQQFVNGPSNAYLWGYNGEYLVAEIKNSKNNNVFYDSFEEGNGNSTVNNSKTGHYSYNGAYSKKLTGLDIGSYILSYWAKSGDKWSLVTVPVVLTGSSYTISLSGQIDDIRFYPSAAQMTTYTYDPLIGMTSATDGKDQITYYEYDGFQRLMNVKDQSGNIIKHTDYNYKNN